MSTPRATSLLRFITCGSVDDGKSTLIGRLLFESRLILDDQLEALEADSRKWGTQGAALDLALVVDGLSAEREQGITIDVGYRFFHTEHRKFIVADTPGHEQYTRNMVTGASTADLAVILVDATKGVLTQTRRHSFLVKLIGIRHVVLAVNKLDLVGFSAEVFERIVADFRHFALQIGLPDVLAIPVSGLSGDNVVRRSSRTPWYPGPTLLQLLERCEIDTTRMQRRPLRLPVQWVNRPDASFRGYCGMIVGGELRPGDRVCVLPSCRETHVARIVGFDADRPHAVTGESVTVTMADDIDISRGDLIVAAHAPASVADQFECTIVWLSDEPMLPGRSYLMKIGPCTVAATVSELKYRVDVNTLEHLAAKTLAVNGVAVCNLSLAALIGFDPYDDNRDTGGFILIDRETHHTIGAGMLKFALRRAHNVHWQTQEVDNAARSALMGQRPAVLWFTGLSGAGKSTIANLVCKRLHTQGLKTYLLDGDNLRHGLNRDLGFTDADRVENIRRVAEVARLMVDAGLIVLTAFISPFRAERSMARDLFPAGQFFEVFVDVPLSVAEGRDTKGLYSKARRGELPHFTGIDSPYESPSSPELRLESGTLTADACAAEVMTMLTSSGVLDA